MHQEIQEKYDQWLDERNSLNGEKDYLAQQSAFAAVMTGRRGPGKAPDKTCVVVMPPDMLDARYLAWNEHDREHVQQLRPLCREYIETCSPERLLNYFSGMLRTQSRNSFAMDLENAAADLRTMRPDKAGSRLRVYFSDGASAFIRSVRPAGNANRQRKLAQSFLLTLLRRDKVGDKMAWLIRTENDLHSALLRNISSALELGYEQAAKASTPNDLRRLIGDDRQLRNALRRVKSRHELDIIARQTLLDHIPDDYAKFYPAARSIHRHFILHIGPTNSGKSYSAIQALHRAEDGVYLAPLRLLAYEQFDSLNKDGVYCSMKTGEEQIDVPGATVQASTIEMLNTQHHHDIAVIDEAQMIQDPMRGGHWTRAILGVWAEEIHVCLAPEAEEIIIRMIGQCEDSYEIVRHERFTALTADTRPMRFPFTVEDGDAYIVFSRSSVHACAAELQKHGVETSIIYGALPYDVRQNEARRFREGETRVVVATDAIGMGLNLPIKRVAFLETEKFDGVQRRPLLPTECKQIAGRAGRYGQFDEGLYASSFRIRSIIEAVESELPQIEYAHLLFPESLLGVEGPLSHTLELWNQLPAQSWYKKGDTEQEIRLAKELEPYSNDKRLIYSLVSIPFDDGRESVSELWKTIALAAVRGKPIPIEENIPDISAFPAAPDMELLELTYKLCDLLYHCAERFAPELSPRIMHEKRLISEKMMAILTDSSLPPRTCRKCRRPIAWNSPYPLCSRCRMEQDNTPRYRYRR